MQGERVQIHRAADRPVTRVPGGLLLHAFSAGAHYDPGNTSFGPLVLHDEVRLEPGAGFPDHPHAGVRVVTHVLSGTLRHREERGSETVLRPGDTGVMAAGTGLVHAEHAGPDGAHYLQAFLLDDTAAPHAVHRGAQQVPVAGAVLRVLRPAAGVPLRVEGPRVHLHLVSGGLQVQGERLGAGDAVRADGALVLQAGEVPALAVAWSLPE